MVQDNPPWKGQPPGHVPQILVIGLGKMGQRVVIEAARSWKLSNPGPDQKLKIAVIDIAADQKLHSLQNQNPRLDDLAEFQSINMDIRSGDFDKAADLFCSADDCKLDIAYICLDDETFCLQTGTSLKSSAPATQSSDCHAHGRKRRFGPAAG